MTLATMMTITAFVVVLNGLHWTWAVSGANYSDTEFTHSIFGMFTIGFSFIQVIDFLDYIQSSCVKSKIMKNYFKKRFLFQYFVVTKAVNIVEFL